MGANPDRCMFGTADEGGAIACSLWTGKIPEAQGVEANAERRVRARLIIPLSVPSL